MSYVIKFQIISKIEKITTRNEFLNYDYRVNNSIYSENQWLQTQKHGLENGWIFDRSSDYWDPVNQEMVFLLFCRDKESAEKFLQFLNEASNFQEALSNEKTHGLCVTMTILEGVTGTLSENFERC
jgi:hypothetical protein